MKKEKRFEVIINENVGGMKSATILLDKLTGVQYLYISEGYPGGLTVLVDKDGKPIVWDPE